MRADQFSQWALLLRSIEGSDGPTPALDRNLTPIRGFFAASLPLEERDSHYQELKAAVIRAIRVGGIRDPQSLSAYAWSTAQRVLRLRSGRPADEPAIAHREPIGIQTGSKPAVGHALAALPEKQREVAIRYYVKGESREGIQRQMGLTPTQFRLLKSRAKAALVAVLEDI